MTDQLEQFSDALAARVESTKPTAVAIRLAHERFVTGIVWQSDVVVASEQSLPRREEFEIVMTGGTVTTVKVAGRDSSTNIAVLRPQTPLASSSITTNEVRAGAIVIAIGADGTGGASARLGIINIAGPEWHSSRGGLIDRRIALDVRLARSEEGGPIFDAAGSCIGAVARKSPGLTCVIVALGASQKGPFTTDAFRKEKVEGLSASFTRDFPAYSVTVMKLKAK